MDTGQRTTGFVDALVAISEAIGTERLEKELADAMGAAIDCDFITMARYSALGRPCFLIHSHCFPSRMAELYLSQYIHLDPYVEYWRSSEMPGVVRPRELTARWPHYQDYVRVFLPEIGVRDEIGVFMPPVARDSIAFFFNNRTRLFTDGEVARLQNLFAACAALYRLHVRVLLDGDGAGVGGSPSLGRPLRVTNHTGSTIWVTNEWREQENPDAQLVRTSVAEEFGSSQRYLWTLAPRGAAQGAHDYATFESWAHQIGLTPRERDVTGLALRGHSSAGIAKALGLSVGNVKNHKRRIYNKLDITSERELFLMYIEAMSAAVQG